MVAMQIANVTHHPLDTQRYIIKTKRIHVNMYGTLDKYINLFKYVRRAQKFLTLYTTRSLQTILIRVKARTRYLL